EDAVLENRFDELLRHGDLPRSCTQDHSSAASVACRRSATSRASSRFSHSKTASKTSSISGTAEKERTLIRVPQWGHSTEKSKGLNAIRAPQRSISRRTGKARIASSNRS